MSTSIQLPASSKWKSVLGALLGICGLLGLPLLWHEIQPYQINVTHYRLQFYAQSVVNSVRLASVAVFGIPIFLAAWAARRSSSRPCPPSFLRLLAPLSLTAPAAVYIAGGWARTVSNGFDTPLDQFFSGFHLVLLAIIGAAGTAYLAASYLGPGSSDGQTHLPLLLQNTANAKPPPVAFHRAAVAGVLLAIAVLTFIHVRIQLNYYNHFMFGHADIGHFTEELKNALDGRGLRSDSFENTRLGWHFVPLLYVLVPGYALWPSITYLMTIGPLVLHLTALPAFWFVRNRTGSVAIAACCATAWLLLPSVSRLVYSNTYGFAWLYTSVPLLGLLLAAALLDKWKLCWVLMAVLLLSRETHAAITLGFGIYLAMFTPRRRAGVAVAVISIAYAVLCAAVIIPYFAKAGRYERLDVFGELGKSIGDLAISAWTKPELFFGRLVRSQSVNLLLLLMATMCFLPMRGFRFAVAALPAIAVHLLMQNPDWISIKFWHHAMVLPILFFAALSRMGPSRTTETESAAAKPIKSSHFGGNSLAMSAALLVAASWSHYFFGFSPIAKAYEPYASDAFLQSPDPRLAFVNDLRSKIPLDRTILATERLAAHFTDYKRIYTGGRIQPADYVVLDRSDQWDRTGLPDKAREFAADPDYERYAESGPIVVFARKPNAPAIPLAP